MLETIVKTIQNAGWPPVFSAVGVAFMLAGIKLYFPILRSNPTLNLRKNIFLTPKELLKLVERDMPINNRMVFNMVRGYSKNGMVEKSSLRQVHKNLQEVWPKVTFDEVSDAYKAYKERMNSEAQ